MTFNEAITGLLAGKKVRKSTWPATEYIYLSGDLVLTDNNKRYQMNRVDMEANWEEYHSLKPGSSFVKDGQTYRVVSLTPSMWSLINVDDWYVVYEDLTSAALIDRLKDRGFY